MPMTLAEMRSYGIRSVMLDCNCGHTAVANVDRFPDSAGVPDARLRFRCTRCGGRPYRSMPNWVEEGPVPGVPNTRQSIQRRPRP